MKTIYKLERDIAEVPYKKRNTLKAGVTFDFTSGNNEPMANFDTLEEAKAELNKHRTSIQLFSNNGNRYFYIEEYYISEWEVDEEGEEEFSGYVDYSSMEFNVVNEYDAIIGTYDNCAEAENAAKNYKDYAEIKF